MKKISLWVLTVLLSVSIVAAFSIYGCKKPAVPAEEIVEEVEEVEEVPTPEEEVSLDFWFQDWPGGKLWIESYIPLFEEKNPNIKVNIILVPYEELATKIFPAVAAGEEPDIFMIYDVWFAGTDLTGVFGVLTPDLYSVEEFKEKVYEQTLTYMYGSDKNIYGVPMASGAINSGIIYHKDIIDEAGVDISAIETWGDLKDVAKKLTTYNEDGSISRSGMSLGMLHTGYILNDMIAAQGASDKLFNEETGEWNYNIPEAKKAMEILKSFVDEEIYNPFEGDVMTAFPNKLIAMMNIGPWALGAWVGEYPELELGYTFMPKIEGTDRNVFATGSFSDIAISKRLEGDKRNAALILLRDIVENPAFFDVPIDNGYWIGVPASKPYVDNLVNLAEEGKLSGNKEIVANVASSYLPNIELILSRLSAIELYETLNIQEMQSVFLGEKTIDEMLDYLTTNATLKEQEEM